MSSTRALRPRARTRQRLHARRPDQIAPRERAQRYPREVVGTEASLQARVGVDPLDDARVDAEAGGEREAAAVGDLSIAPRVIGADEAKVDPAGTPVIG